VTTGRDCNPVYYCIEIVRSPETFELSHPPCCFLFAGFQGSGRIGRVAHVHIQRGNRKGTVYPFQRVSTSVYSTASQHNNNNIIQYCIACQKTVSLVVYSCTFLLRLRPTTRQAQIVLYYRICIQYVRTPRILVRMLSWLCLHIV